MAKGVFGPRNIRILGLSIAVITLFSGQAVADFEKGQRAFSAGDVATALEEWKSAGYGGDARALYKLGKLYEDGVGVPQVYVRAHYYFNLAAAKGNAAARDARNRIARQMTLEELAEARSLASAGLPKIRPASGSETQKSSTENFDGKWRWSIDWMASACVGMRTEQMVVKDNTFTTMVTHPADSQLGWTTGKIDRSGKTSFFTAGQYIGIQFDGKFVGDTAAGVTVGNGEDSCHGTWKAEKIN